MNKLSNYIYIILLCILPIHVNATVQVEMKTNTLTETIWSDGNKLHVRSDDEAGYILVDAKQRHLHSVNQAEKQLVDLSDKVKQVPVMPKLPGIEIEYLHHGTGPIILGFQTELYILMVNGDICRTEYLLTSSAELTAVVEGLELMTEYRINTTFGSLPGELELCFVADHVTHQRYRKHGFPLKSEDQFGKAQLEVISINLDAKNPINNFNFPESYISMSYEEMIETAGSRVTGGTDEMHPSPVSTNKYSQ